MPHKCVIIKQPDYLLVKVTGDCEPGEELDDAIDVWIRVADMCRETGKNRVLSVWDVPGHLPTMKAYNLASNPDAFGWDYRFKVAIVHLNEDRFKDALFAETVAVNRGYNIKIFRDEEKARKWLLQD